MKFRIYIGVPNPEWTMRNHTARYLTGEPLNVSAYLRTQSFNDGSGTLHYYIGWKVQINEK
jgi:hypothetical protein